MYIINGSIFEAFITKSVFLRTYLRKFGAILGHPPNKSFPFKGIKSYFGDQIYRTGSEDRNPGKRLFHCMYDLFTQHSEFFSLVQ